MLPYRARTTGLVLLLAAALAALDAITIAAIQGYCLGGGLQVALAWLLKRSKVILPIPGTSSIPHLDENVAAAGLKLPKAAYDKLSAVSPSPVSLRG